MTLTNDTGILVATGVSINTERLVRAEADRRGISISRVIKEILDEHYADA